MIYRNAISSIIVGLIALGTGLQAYTDVGKFPDKFEWIKISVPALILLLNDIKSRITPTEKEVKNA